MAVKLAEIKVWINDVPNACPNFLTAQAVLDIAQKEVPFVITWADGQVDSGRYDPACDKDLVGHVRLFCEGHAGRRCPAGLPQDEYEELVAAFGIADECSRVLDDYQLGDA